MSGFQVWLTIALSFLGIILIPLLFALIKVVQRATRLEVKQDQLVKSLASLVQDQEKIHASIFQQQREDRKATNTRLRWLEQNVWKGTQ